MSEVIDPQGRWILTPEEPCRFCKRSSKEMHPAGVVSKRWTCTSCGFRQDGVRVSGPTVDARRHGARP